MLKFKDIRILMVFRCGQYFSLSQSFSLSLSLCNFIILCLTLGPLTSVWCSSFNQEVHILQFWKKSWIIQMILIPPPFFFCFYFSDPFYVVVELPKWLKRWRICLECSKHRFDPWIGKIPWRRKLQPTTVFSPGESHWQRSLVGYSPRGCKELDMTEVT